RDVRPNGRLRARHSAPMTLLPGSGSLKPRGPHGPRGSRARRHMAHKIATGRAATARPLLGIGILATLVAAAAFGVATMVGRPPGGPGRPSASMAVAAAPSESPTRTHKPTSGGAGSGVSTAPPTRSSTPTPDEEATHQASAVPTPTPAPADTSAPNRPADLDLVSQAIDIVFPLRPETRYSYRDNWLDVRDGAPEAYNHARVDRDGAALRLHDGIDIYAAEGEPVVAPFAGTVIDPSTRWTPWISNRYGRTVVIVSDERGSRGYVAVLAHANDVWVVAGDHVTRGQVVGTIGRTGNAEFESSRAYVHFELRAPFLVDWTPVGEDRQSDAFNPFSSLLWADPKQT
ncbi:MAG: peptidoglycan DD-metalloendopeptidase family protein, partial [Candidatus Limnocylindrales bacterium]